VWVCLENGVLFWVTFAEIGHFKNYTFSTFLTSRSGTAFPELYPYANSEYYFISQLWWVKNGVSGHPDPGPGPRTWDSGQNLGPGPRSGPPGPGSGPRTGPDTPFSSPESEYPAILGLILGPGWPDTPFSGSESEYPAIWTLFWAQKPGSWPGSWPDTPFSSPESEYPAILGPDLGQEWSIPGRSTGFLAGAAESGR